MSNVKKFLCTITLLMLVCSMMTVTFAAIAEESDVVTGGSVTVIQPTSLSLSRTSVTLNIGQSASVSATVSPSNATNKTVYWSSNNSGTARVSGGTITGVSEGSCTITAKTANGISKTIYVKVNPPVATGISLNRSSATLEKGQTLTLTATKTPSGAQGNIQWLSTAPDIASVSGAGVVTARTVGTATITAKISDTVKARCTITVKEKEVEKCTATKVLTGHTITKTYGDKTETTHSTTFKCTTCNVSWKQGGVMHVYTNGKCICGYVKAATGVSLNRSSATLEKGETLKLTANILPSGAQGNIQWLSTKPTIAYVSGGTVQAKSVGTAIITAKINDTIKAQCTVTVIEKEVEEPEQPVVEKCSKEKILHYSKLETTFRNVTATTHDAVIKCKECNTSWVNPGIRHVYNNGECPCGKDQAVSSIALNKTSATLEKGQTLTLKATLFPTGAKGTVQWLSTKPNIAYVSGGKVQAKSVGTAIITAKINDTVKAQCAITVIEKQEELNKCSVDYNMIGHEEKLVYTYSDKKAKTHDVTIRCPECKTSWKMNDKEHIFIAGKCACGKNPIAEKIELDKTQATMNIGEKLTLNAQILPEGATGRIQWLSTNPKVALVSNGVITAKKEGTVTITAKINNTVKAQCTIIVVKAQEDEPEQPVNPSGDIIISKCSKDGIVAGHEEKIVYTYSDKKAKTHDVTIKCTECKNKSWRLNDVEHDFTNGTCVCGRKPAPTKVVLNYTKKILEVGERLQLRATVYPEGYGYEVIWVQTGTEYADADSKGLVNALKAGGIAKITAKVKGFEDIKAVCEIEVIPKDCEHENYEIKYELLDEEMHLKYKNCKDCKTVLNSINKEHEFNSKGICICGFKKGTKVLKSISFNQDTYYCKVKDTINLKAELSRTPDDIDVDLIFTMAGDIECATLARTGGKLIAKKETDNLIVIVKDKNTGKTASTKIIIKK